jgi:hypothetical protein
MVLVVVGPMCACLNNSIIAALFAVLYPGITPIGQDAIPYK